MNEFIVVKNAVRQEIIINLNNVTCICPSGNQCTVYFTGSDDDKVNIKHSIEEMRTILGINK